MADSISRKLLIAEAKNRNWQVSYVGRKNYFCAITDKKGRTELFRGSRPLRTSANGVLISAQKDLTMQFVQYLGYKVPDYEVIEPDESSERAIAFLKRHRAIVVKPVDGHRSVGVRAEICTEDDLVQAIHHARSAGFSDRVMLQEQLNGKLYRLFVLNGKFVAAASRSAPKVVGDGIHTLKQLVDELNQDPRRSNGVNTPLKKVSLEATKELLGEETLSKIPNRGEEIKVARLDSLGSGGEATDVTESVHPDWYRVAIELADRACLTVCGHDVICEDISKPIPDKYLPLLEMNSEPGLKMHHFPTGGGKPVNVAAKLLDELFP